MTFTIEANGDRSALVPDHRRHGLHRRVRRGRVFTALLPGAPMTEDELVALVVEDLDEAYDMALHHHPRPASQHAMAAAERAMGGDGPNAASVSSGDFYGIGQSVASAAASTSDGAMAIFSQRGTAEKGAQHYQTSLLPGMATPRAMDVSWCRLVRQLHRAERRRWEETGRQGTPPPAPGRMVRDLNRLIDGGELVEQNPYLAKVEVRTARDGLTAEYVCYIDKVDNAGRKELNAKRRGAHRQHVILRLLPGVPGMPTRMVANTKDSTYLAAGENIEELLPLLTAMVGREHHGESGGPEPVTGLIQEVGRGNVGSTIGRLPTQDMATAASAGALSTLVNMYARTWDNRSAVLYEWIYWMRYTYGAAAPSADRDQLHLDLAKFATARLAELMAEDPAFVSQAAELRDLATATRQHLVLPT